MPTNMYKYCTFRDTGAFNNRFRVDGKKSPQTVYYEDSIVFNVYVGFWWRILCIISYLQSQRTLTCKRNEEEAAAFAATDTSLLWVMSIHRIYFIFNVYAKFLQQYTTRKQILYTGRKIDELCNTNDLLSQIYRSIEQYYKTTYENVYLWPMSYI
jgi:hypothetical protein